MARSRFYIGNWRKTPRFINSWDMIAFAFVFGVVILLTWGARGMTTPYHLGETIPMSLAIKNLPYYASRSVLRIFIALIFSLLFTFIFGTWAARSQRAERLLLPIIDILQAVPVLSFLSITIVVFIALFPNSILGPECASIFAIFTSQAWNMTFGFYQSLRTVPSDLQEAGRMLHLSHWQRFWRIDVPFAIPSLLWNTMMSLSASWFFVVASEAIQVSNQHIRLPGIGSYIAVAIEQANLAAVGYAIFTMLIVILIYDQLLFRPLLKWSERFRAYAEPEDRPYHSWFYNVLNRAHLMQFVREFVSIAFNKVINYFPQRTSTITSPLPIIHKFWPAWLGRSFLFITVSLAIFILGNFILRGVTWHEVLRVFELGFITALRVVILIVIAALFWVPMGVWIGRNPRATQIAQPIAQFLAAFPANLMFPVAVVIILRYHLNTEIWLTPLMILGSQWYILFNVIAGTANLPKEMVLAANNFGVSGWQWWRRLMLPGIYPYFITGAITAAGGAWNASIVAEVVSWGDHSLMATGLGAYIARYTMVGDFHRIALGTAVMCLFVLAFNRILWRPLYALAEERYQLT